MATRTRNYATVIYPSKEYCELYSIGLDYDGSDGYGSAPDNWREILSEMCIPCFISPCHDKDINPDGKFKKPHFHVMLMFDGVKTSEQVQSIFSQIGGVGLEIVQSIRGYARYLCHLDNPEKNQYSTDDVVSFGGADYFSVISLVTDKYAAISDMLDYIDSENINSYFLLLDYSRKNRQDWFRVLCDSGSYVIKEAIKSRSYMLK